MKKNDYYMMKPPVVRKYVRVSEVMFLHGGTEMKNFVKYKGH